MKLFSCSIEGTNFALKLDSEPALFGFYTTRFVRAETAEQAELLALELLRSDPKLDVKPANRSKDTMIYFESIVEIDPMPVGISEPSTGYTFYPMGT